MANFFRGFIVGAIFAAAYVLLCAGARADEISISVNLDQARIMHMPDNADTIILGNPLIADLSVRANGIIVITGKSAGRTNLLFLTKRGDVLSEKQIVVQPMIGIVTIVRGMTRQSYACNPSCEPVPVVGDGQLTFDQGMKQTMSRLGASAPLSPAGGK